MRFRHALAISMLGWFLMAPPFNHATKKIEAEAPLSRWENLRSNHSRWGGEFESRENCEQFKASFFQWWDHRAPDFRKQPFHRVIFEQMRLAKCITPDSLASAFADKFGED